MENKRLPLGDDHRDVHTVGPLFHRAEETGAGYSISIRPLDFVTGLNPPGRVILLVTIAPLSGNGGWMQENDLEMLISELSRGCGVPSTFVETNCFWCSCDRVVREKLELLKEKGLKGVLVPFEYTERAVRIAQELFG